VANFSALSEEWWDPRKNPLISMNVCRVQYILDHVRNHYTPEISSEAHLSLKGLRALDIGCGGGLLSESLVRLGAQTTGIDPSKQLVQAAIRHAKTNLHPHQYHNQQLQYHGGVTVEQYLETMRDSASTASSSLSTFDIVCCLEVIEHVPDPTSLLHAATQLLKPNGLLFISSINQTMISYLMTIVGAEYIFRWIPIGTHSYQQYKSPTQVQHMLSSSLSDSNHASMRPINVSGMVIPPLCLPAVVLHNQWHWKLDPSDTDVNWIACYQKQSNGKVV
jgi:ubiquinone biosynthesis O-methyltransferase